jgi:hypothetical protein
MASCIRCKQPIRGSALMAFPPRRDPGHTWKPLPDVVLCVECGGNGHNVLTTAEYAEYVARGADALFDLDPPPDAPYPEPGGQETTGGWSGTDTSQARARREAADGTLSARQTAVLRYLDDSGRSGATWKETADALDLHHGQASGALSNMHHSGRIRLLDLIRHRCHVYVLPEYVDGRPTIEPRRNKPAPGTGHDPATLWAEGYVAGIGWAEDPSQPEPPNPYEEH